MIACVDMAAAKVKRAGCLSRVALTLLVLVLFSKFSEALRGELGLQAAGFVATSAVTKYGMRETPPVLGMQVWGFRTESCLKTAQTHQRRQM